MRFEDYLPAGEIVIANLTRDLQLFTVQYRNIDDKYVASFRLLLNETGEMQSVFSVTEEQKKLTVELYVECDGFINRLNFMKSYAKEVGLNYNIIVTAVKQFRNRNVEGAVKNCRDAMTYYIAHSDLFETSNMPEGFADEMQSRLQKIETLNNKHNMFVVNRKEVTAQNRAVYKRLYGYISEVCAAGRLVFKHDAVKRSEYTISKIANVLQSSRKKKEDKEA